VKIWTYIIAILLVCFLECRAQQLGDLPDQQVFAAAAKAFVAGNWNPDIFEAKPTVRRLKTLDEILSSQQELKQELQKEFGTGPCAIVAYTRRPDTLKTNGGESYCTIFFVVFSAAKVAVIDGRAYSRPKDMLPKKSS
jgi:hypothetical protein